MTPAIHRSRRDMKCLPPDCRIVKVARVRKIRGTIKGWDGADYLDFNAFDVDDETIVSLVLR